MFHADPDRTQWSKFKTGVVCFVKDNVKKSYYVRLVDLSVSGLVLIITDTQAYLSLSLPLRPSRLCMSRRSTTSSATAEIGLTSIPSREM